jgi:hypothetical protein
VRRDAPADDGDDLRPPTDRFELGVGIALVVAFVVLVGVL